MKTEQDIDEFEHKPENLDLDTWKIFKIVAEEAMDSVTTTEIKQRTELEKNHRILYRLDKLEANGWIKTSQPYHTSPGIAPPKQAKITREGLDALELQPDSEELCMQERIEEAESSIRNLRQRVEDLESRVQSDQMAGQETNAVLAYLSSELNVDEEEILSYSEVG